MRSDINFLQRLLDTVETIILCLDREGFITLINDYGARLLGCPLDEMTGRHWFAEFLPQPEGMQRVYPVFCQLMAGQLEQSEYFENEILLASGERRLIAWHNTYWTSPDGTVIGTLSAGTDITRHRCIEDALRISNLEMSRAQAIGQLGSWWLDLQHNRLIWSEETYRLLGVPAGVPLTYEEFLKRVHPEDRIYVDAQWQAALEGAPYDIEHRFLIHQRIHWLRERAEVEFDAEGTPMRAHGTVQDITERKLSNLALEESESWLRRAQRAAGIGVYDYDITRDRWSSSAELDAIFGIDADYPRNVAGWLSLVHPEDRSVMADHLTEVAEGRRSRFDREYRIQRLGDGETRWLHGIGEIEHGVTGCPWRMTGTIWDITARKRAEIARDEALGRYQRLFMCSPLPMWVVDRESLRFYDVNEAACMTYGYDRQEFMGLRLSDLVPSELHDVLKQRLGPNGHPMKGEVVSNVRKDQGTMHVAIWSDDIVHEGRKARLAVVQDVSLQMELEAERNKKIALDEQLNQLAAAVPGAIYSFRRDPDGRYTLPYLAGRQAQVFGVDVEQLMEDAWPLFERIFPDDLSKVLEGIEQSATTLEPWRGLFRTGREGELVCWIEGSSIPRLEPDGSTLWHGYLSDVSDRIAATQALQHSRDQLLALTARLEIVREEERTRIARELHDELGQNLTAVRMHLRRIGITANGPELEQQLSDIERMVEETTQAVRRISHELRPRLLDTLDLGGAIEWEVAAFSKRHGIRCLCQVPEVELVLPEQIKTHLYRVFQEAMTNIARHAHPSRVEVSLCLEVGGFRLMVADNGVGLTGEALASNTLGLAGMSERASQMGAKLTITSAPCIEGTRVELWLPLPLAQG